MAPLEFGKSADVEIVREAERLYKLLRTDSELKKNISKGVVETKYAEFKKKWKEFTDEIKRLKSSPNPSTLFLVTEAKKYRNELKGEFVGFVVREILARKHGLQIATTPIYKR